MSDSSARVAELCDAMVAAHPPVHTIRFVFDGFPIEVGTNSLALADRLRDYFRHYVVESITPHEKVLAIEAEPPEFGVELPGRHPAHGSKPPKEHYGDVADGRIIRKVRTGLQYLVDGTRGGRRMAVGPCEANTNQIINFVNDQVTAARLAAGALLMHASGVCTGGAGLAIAAASGAGKSTLALHLVRAGWDYVSNDRLLAHHAPEGVVMHGIPKQPRVNPGTILNNPNLCHMLENDKRAAYEALPIDELRRLEDKYDVDMERSFGPDRWQLSAPLCGLLILNWKPVEEKALVREVKLDERRDLLALVMKEPSVTYVRGDAADPTYDGSERSYIQLLDGYPVYEAVGGVDYATMIDTCPKLVGRNTT